MSASNIKRKSSPSFEGQSNLEDGPLQSKISKTRITGKLSTNFFDTSCTDLANSLLGKLLVRKLPNGEVLKARIVETEIYPGGEDKASHSYNGRRTPRNEPMYMDAGTSYVYMTFGMYFCLNISSNEPGGAVLIRAAEPISGTNTMLKFRTEKQKSKRSKRVKEHEICNGPSKLCIAMSINKDLNALDFCKSEEFWMETDEGSYEDKQVISAKRIGIDSVGEEWAGKLFRYYILGNKYVSKRDRIREENAVPI